MKIYAVGLFGVLLTDSSFAIAKSFTSSNIGQPLTANDRRPAKPQPFVYDDSGNGNFLQIHGSKPAVNVFSDDHSLSYHRRSDALVIELPNDLPLQVAYCFKIIPAQRHY